MLWAWAVPLQERLDILRAASKAPKRRSNSNLPNWREVGRRVGRNWRTCRSIWFAARYNKNVYPLRTGGQKSRKPTLSAPHLLVLKVRRERSDFVSMRRWPPFSSRDALLSLQIIVELEPDIFLHELKAKFRHKLGLKVSESQLCRGLQLLGLTLKVKTRIVRGVMTHCLYFHKLLGPKDARWFLQQHHRDLRARVLSSA